MTDAVPGAARKLSREDKLNALLDIAKAMTAERHLDTLLPLIMQEAVRVVEAERCSLFILDRRRGELWSRIAQGATREIRVRLGEGLAGAVAASGTSILLEDAWDDPRFNRSFDLAQGFRTRSVLCVPMRDAHGVVTGVIQALNAHEGRFDAEDEELLTALGGQAASAIENAVLHEEIQGLFEGFVQASVLAIEQRDPTTAGHSNRVAALTLELARTTVQAPPAGWRGLRFSDDDYQEIRYASLLHDFGKVGVREAVLVKANKLFPEALELLRLNFELCRQTALNASLERRLEWAALPPGERAMKERAEADGLAATLKRIDESWSFVLACNQPTVLPQGGFERLQELASLSWVDTLGESHPLVDPIAIEALSVPRGSLTPRERDEIQSHVTHTFRFLSQIPWSERLSRVPHIAYAHHEMLNGKGYPRLLEGQAVPVQSRMMAIADIYDALTASDRPYKKAIPHHRALDILADEAKQGRLDTELLGVFVEGQVPQRALARLDARDAE